MPCPCQVYRHSMESIIGVSGRGGAADTIARHAPLFSTKDFQTYASQLAVCQGRRLSILTRRVNLRQAAIVHAVAARSLRVSESGPGPALHVPRTSGLRLPRQAPRICANTVTWASESLSAPLQTQAHAPSCPTMHPSRRLGVPQTVFNFHARQVSKRDVPFLMSLCSVKPRPMACFLCALT